MGFEAIYNNIISPDGNVQGWFDWIPIDCACFDKKGNILAVNKMWATRFDLNSPSDFIRFLPDKQPCGTPSKDILLQGINETMDKGFGRFALLCGKSNNDTDYMQITMRRETNDLVIVFAQDEREVILRQQLNIIEGALAKIREAEEMNEILLNASPFATDIWDEDFKLTYCSEQALILLDINSTEEYIDNFYKYSPVRQPCNTFSEQKMKRYLGIALMNGVVRFNYTHITSEGELMPTEVTLIRVKHKGKTVLVRYFVDNRIAQKAIEREMELERELEMFEHIQVMFDASPMAVNLYDASGTILDCNMEAVRVFGFNNKADYLQAFKERFNDFSVEGKLKGMMGEAIFRERVQYECEYITNSGEHLPVEVTIVRINNNTSFVLIVYMRDLREVRAAEEKEREVRERTRIMLGAAPLMIQFWDKELNNIDCNQWALDFYGFDTKEEYFAGLKGAIIENQSDGSNSWDKWHMFLKETFDRGYSFIEFEEATLNGDPVCFETVGLRTMYQDDMAVITYATDVTEMKKMQTEQRRIGVAEESNRAKTRFLARMSHEIRTPITAVLGISEIQLQNPELPLHIEESFAKIHSSSNLLLSIINDILDLSKIEAGKMNIIEDDYEVTQLINSATLLHLAFASGKNIRFNLQVDENLPSVLRGDSVRIEQIMNNLLSNAFKYTEAGSVDLKFDAELDGIKIAVKDTGLGMSPEQVEVLFSEYTRFHEDKRYVAGTGLGMSIVSNLVQLMDAEIDIQSEVGKGTTVSVYIPQRIVNLEPLGFEAARKLEQFQSTARNNLRQFNFVPDCMPYGRVLVVDDVEANLYVAHGLLSFYDLRIETCTNGYDAIEKIEKGETYDIIFMDHMMPGISGIDTMKTLRKLGYTATIIVLTANAMIGQAESFVNNGFDGFISKPINTNHLNTILVKYIRDKYPQDVVDAANAAKLHINKQKANVPSIAQFQDSETLIEKLRIDFAKKQKNAMTDIKKALGECKLGNVHIITHTIKGLAGLIHEPALATAAKAVESFAEKNMLPEEKAVRALDTEMTRVLDSIHVEDGSKNYKKALEALKKIHPVLEERKADCINMLEELREIPEAAIFVRQVEMFQFSYALDSYEALIGILDE